MIQIPEHIPTWWYAVAGAVAAIALLVWIYLLLRAYRTRRAIDAAISSIAYEMLKNVLIPNGNGGQIHVHYLLLTQRGLLVADLLWVNAELRGDYEVGAGIDFAYFLFYLCLFMGAWAQRRHRRPTSDTLGLQGDLRGSLPVVALATGIIALLDDRLQLTNFESPRYMKSKKGHSDFTHNSFLLHFIV